MHSELPDFATNLFNALAEREQMLFDYFLKKTNGTVQSGPFQGMKILPKYSWLFHGHLVPQWIGEYEAQLHGVMRELAAQSGISTLVNLGCGNGYYSIGWARTNENSRVLSLDLSEAAIALSKENAELNGVASRIEFYLDYQKLYADLATSSSKLIYFIDIEGFEADVIEELSRLDLLQGSDLIIECHDVGYIDKNITPRLIDVLNKTHDINRIDSHNSSVDRFDLRAFTDLDRFIMTTEWRPASMHWLICRSRSQTQ